MLLLTPTASKLRLSQRFALSCPSSNSFSSVARCGVTLLEAGISASAAPPSMRCMCTGLRPSRATPLATSSLTSAMVRICAIRLALKVRSLARSVISAAEVGLPARRSGLICTSRMSLESPSATSGPSAGLAE